MCCVCVCLELLLDLISSPDAGVDCFCHIINIGVVPGDGNPWY